MKRFYSILSAAILLGTTRPAASAALEVSVDFFHDHLESYGDWREVGDYGYCWQPRDVGRDWRPYSDGRWLYTDAGWTWDSEEPYSWAVYHYGRWTRVDRVGWVWVPGTEWGPAWVSWRRSPRHVGWAPLPPEAEFSRSVGFSAQVDADYDIGPTNYSFVLVRNFGAPRLRTVIVEPRENITIINQTTNITRITYLNKVVYNEGPQYDVISRESSQPIRRLRLERRQEFEGDPRSVRAEQLRSRVDGDSLRVVAPQFDAKPATAPRNVAAKVEKPEVDRGWKNAGPPAAVAKLRTKIKSDSAAPAAQPSQPKAEKAKDEPVSARPDAEGVPAGAPPTGGKVTEGNAGNGGVSKAPAPKVGKSQIVEKPMPAERTQKAEKKPRKPVSQEPARPQTLPPAAATPEQSKPRKPRNNGVEAPRPPAKAPQQAQPPRQKKQNFEPSRELQGDAVVPTRQESNSNKRDAQPKPMQSPVRSVERKAPNAPQPRPQAKSPEPRKSASPSAAQPQPPQPTKGKGKGKDEKKNPDEEAR